MTAWKAHFISARLGRGVTFTTRDEKDINALLNIMESLRERVVAMPSLETLLSEALQETTERLLEHAVRLANGSLNEWGKKTGRREVKTQAKDPQVRRLCAHLPTSDSIEEGKFFSLPGTALAKARSTYSKSAQSTPRSSPPVSPRTQTCRRCGEEFTGALGNRPQAELQGVGLMTTGGKDVRTNQESSSGKKGTDHVNGKVYLPLTTANIDMLYKKAIRYTENNDGRGSQGRRNVFPNANEKHQRQNATCLLRTETHPRNKWVGPPELHTPGVSAVPQSVHRGPRCEGSGNCAARTEEKADSAIGRPAANKAGCPNYEGADTTVQPRTNQPGSAHGRTTSMALGKPDSRCTIDVDQRRCDESARRIANGDAGDQGYPDQPASLIPVSNGPPSEIAGPKNWILYPDQKANMPAEREALRHFDGPDYSGTEKNRRCPGGGVDKTRGSELPCDSGGATTTHYSSPVYSQTSRRGVFPGHEHSVCGNSAETQAIRSYRSSKDASAPSMVKKVSFGKTAVVKKENISTEKRRKIVAQVSKGEKFDIPEDIPEEYTTHAPPVSTCNLEKILAEFPREKFIRINQVMALLGEHPGETRENPPIAKIRPKDFEAMKKNGLLRTLTREEEARIIGHVRLPLVPEHKKKRARVIAWPKTQNQQMRMCYKFPCDTMMGNVAAIKKFVHEESIGTALDLTGSFFPDWVKRKRPIQLCLQVPGAVCRDAKQAPVLRGGK